MPKTKKQLQQHRIGGARCPNPTCTSNGKFFATMKQLQGHISHKPDCLAYMVQLRNSLQSKDMNMTDCATNKLSNTANEAAVQHCAVVDHPIALHAADTDVQFPNNNDEPETFHDMTTTPPVAPTDFEHLNVTELQDKDTNGYILNPEPTAFTNARRVEVVLLKILTELEAPLWAFKTIMDWACDACQTGYKFMPKQQTYKSQISTIERWVGMEHMRPTVVDVKLPGKREGDSIAVTTFDFISQFHSLLSDPELNTASNLVANHDDPFTKYKPPDGRLREALSGSWYRRAWRHMKKTSQCNYMIPIILYIDKTQMSLSGKLSLFPVQMSLSIFTEEARRKSSAWRPLGYIANEDYYFSAAERDENSPDVKNQRFHVQRSTP